VISLSVRRGHTVLRKEETQNAINKGCEQHSPRSKSRPQAALIWAVIPTEAGNPPCSLPPNLIFSMVCYCFRTHSIHHDGHTNCEQVISQVCKRLVCLSMALETGSDPSVKWKQHCNQSLREPDCFL
jgi:hypothetical protein